MSKLLTAICFELPSDRKIDEKGGATMTLIPAPGADGKIRGVDGREWRMSRPDQVAKAFTRKRAISENHARVLAAPKGEAAPAFGWIKSVRVEQGAIVGDVQWNPRGQAALNNDEYAFFSPEFTFDDKTGEIQAIVGGALTNDPNLTQLALNSELDTDPNQEPYPMNEIAKLLGLAEGADQAAIITAIKALQEKSATALNAAQHPDPLKFIPAEQHQVALNRASAAEGELQKIKTAKIESEILATVDSALKDGKIVPANKDYFVAMCRAEGGLEQFKKFLETAPVITKTSGADGEPPASGAIALNSEEQYVAQTLGISVEDMNKAGGKK